MRLSIASMMLLAGAVFLSALADEPQGTSDSPNAAIPAKAFAKPKTIEEARSRANLLFEMASGSLQVMHRDFIDDENLHAIPSASLDDVFSEIKKSFQVELKWLNAGTDIVNTDHQPRGQFESQAAEQISRGQPAVEEVADGQYRFVGSITLRSQCLKCHLKDRRSNVDRFAGLIIQMPIEQP